MVYLEKAKDRAQKTIYHYKSVNFDGSLKNTVLTPEELKVILTNIIKPPNSEPLAGIKRIAHKEWMVKKKWLQELQRAKE